MQLTCMCVSSLQGFLAADKEEAMEHFNMAETVFKRCKEKVSNLSLG